MNEPNAHAHVRVYVCACVCEYVCVCVCVCVCMYVFFMFFYVFFFFWLMERTMPRQRLCPSTKGPPVQASIRINPCLLHDCIKGLIPRVERVFATGG